jgi:glycine/D-amino acid oxidase-like deaminating enzyme
VSGTRICVIGGGLAGSLLAWRLASVGAVVDLVTGAWEVDATAVSGGVVRGFERDPLLSAAATSSLVELRASRTLRHWARYQEFGSLYLYRPTRGDQGIRDDQGIPPADPGLQPQLNDLEAQLPGSIRLLDARDLAAAGWARLPGGTIGVAERHAGAISPEGLRRGVFAELARRPAVRLLAGSVTAVRPAGGGVQVDRVPGAGEYDLAVIAAGRWTGPLLERSGLTADGLRTKCVQYSVHEVSGPRPPAFVDETSGLYGRPVGRDRMLLGVPLDMWDVDPDEPPGSARARADATAWAALRLPRMRIVGPPTAQAVSADSYADPPTLALRPVPDADGRVLTFAGGSGGSAKSAFAVSREAAALLSSGRLAPA